MRVLLYVVIIAIVVAAAIIISVVWPTWRMFRSFDRLEQNARQRITPAHLQRWGTNLIAHHPPGPTTVARLGTNFPHQLLGLYRHPPYIRIYEATTNNLGEVRPGWVRLTWGSGFMGHCGFEIGPTNFTGYKRGHAWQDGIYFYRD